MKYYFSADAHLSHENIIKYCKRPFKNIEQMNNTIINNHNKMVAPDDAVFYLGDFCFGSRKQYINQFNGRFIFLKGNHDKKPIVDSITINYGGFSIYMNHWPQNYNPDYDLNLVGHIHEKWKVRDKDNTILINVGVDQWDFKPICIGDIHRLLNETGLRKKLNEG